MDVLRLLRTLWYVPPQALAWRLWARLKRQYYTLPMYGVRGVWQSQGLQPPLKWVGIEIVPGNALRGNALADGRWLLAGQDLPLGVPPRSWLPARAQALQHFEMHYHEWLADLRAADRPETARKLVADWLLQFAHYHPTAWHPYPTSLRIAAWLTYGGWLLAEAEDDFREAYHVALHAQLNYLRHNCEWDLGGNHLIKNLKALLLGALAREDGAALLWAEGALINALRHQILPDGAHDERTPHYHAQVLQDILEIRAALRASGHSGGGVWDTWIAQMAQALAFYTYPDGRLGLWNDGVEGDASRLATLLGYGGNAPAPSCLKAAGYARLQAGKGKRVLGVMFDAGKVGPDENPGHAHADTLAFELWLGTERVVVNQGTLAYQHPLRHALRSTAAHSTLQLEGTESAEVWGGHRVGRRPKYVVLEEREPGRVVAGSHDGYRHMGLTHKRVLQLEDAPEVALQGHDFLSGPLLNGVRQHQRVWVRFHLHPKVQVRQLNEQQAELTLPSGATLQFACTGGRLTVQPSRYAGQWNVLTPTQQLAVRVQQPEVSWRFSLKAPNGGR
ncbi:MAG: heparinase II/III family protein [Pseudomonadota bacterium]